MVAVHFGPVHETCGAILSCDAHLHDVFYYALKTTYNHTTGDPALHLQGAFYYALKETAHNHVTGGTPQCFHAITKRKHF